MFLKRTHTCGELRKKDVGKEVILNGWVDTVRDLGGIRFLMLRDRYGKTQVVFDPSENENAYEKSKKIRNEYVIAVKGLVRERPENTINKNLETGEIEVIASDIEILSESELLPFQINESRKVSEELRLKYRYLDLRREKMKNNIIKRHEVMQFTRKFFSSKGFIEIETPFLTKSTPEGARDFLVPSRLKPGTFYALPQSPQIFKQILMVAGFDKYFQIVRNFRDEDFRADRQPEFTQIDLEMSFVDRDDVLNTMEEFIYNLFKEVENYELNLPLRRFSYDEIMNKYGSDKPDTRYGMEFIDFSEIFKETKANFIREILENSGKIKGFVVKGKAKEFTRKKLDQYTEFITNAGASGLIWIVYSDEIRSTIKKIVQNELEEIAKRGIIDKGDVAFLMAGRLEEVNEYLGLLRSEIIKRELDRAQGFDVFWITDFPMFEWNEEENRLVAAHHPFTMPNLEDLQKYADTDPLKIRAQSYDMVINGFEVASGSIRIHDRNIQRKIFELIGLSNDEINRKFGFLLEAFKFGVPPHGGIAFGLDRLVAIMAGESSIKEVIAFPKTSSGSDPLTGAPDIVSERQLKELHIKIDL